ncbi:MAG TPA: PDR/VanB family oxidoreductase, partial [Rummeliibacillus sp.]|nr:PDR/VanB family oxidoreductase [Rummeliibacillus sp.]
DPQSRGGSVFWHEQAEIGQTLFISFPRNHFPLSSRGRHHAFYAAGIGITPFLTMIRDLPKEDTFELHYAAKTKQSCAFYDYLQEHYPDQTTFYFSRVQNPQRMTTDTMATHRIGTHVYFCGPTNMVDEFRNATKSIGYPDSAIHFELFGNNTDNLPKNPFIVELTESEQILEVSDKETLLETLLKAGIDAPHSCRIGGCGSCEVDVIDGEVEHRDVFLSEENKKTRKTILTCCSRAKTEKLTLKL